MKPIKAKYILGFIHFSIQRQIPFNYQQHIKNKLCIRKLIQSGKKQLSK